MRLVLSVAFAVVVLAFGAGAATAAPAGAPWITAQSAAQELVDYGIEWDEGTDTVDYAWCKGYGRHVGSGYRHFRCYVETEEDDPYWVRVHSSWDLNSVEWIGYD
jgi:hypothetical protein